ncbi:MAG: copy number control protein [Nostoc sp.]|jgi:metal-responsive CopG/Arc/MetJ family transcriptional regulator
MDETKLVAIRVEMPDELRNQFKSVVAREGKNMRDVLLSFIKDYVAERESSQGKGAA